MLFVDCSLKCSWQQRWLVCSPRWSSRAELNRHLLLAARHHCQENSRVRKVTAHRRSFLWRWMLRKVGKQESSLSLWGSPGVCNWGAGRETVPQPWRPKDKSWRLGIVWEQVSGNHCGRWEGRMGKGSVGVLWKLGLACLCVSFMWDSAFSLYQVWDNVTQGSQLYHRPVLCQLKMSQQKKICCVSVWICFEISWFLGKLVWFLVLCCMYLLDMPAKLFPNSPKIHNRLDECNVFCVLWVLLHFEE